MDERLMSIIDKIIDERGELLKQGHHPNALRLLISHRDFVDNLCPSSIEDGHRFMGMPVAFTDGAIKVVAEPNLLYHALN